MAVVPNVNDPHYDEVVARMRKTAKGPEGKDKMRNEFGIDITKGDIDNLGKGSKPSKPNSK